MNKQKYQLAPNTVTEALNTEKAETPNQNQMLNDNDWNTANTTTQTLTQEEKINVEVMKRIMSEKKTTLSSLRSKDWGTVKSETEKVNDLLKNIPTKNITELNDLIYSGAKLVFEKIEVPLETTNKKSKPVWELRLKSQIRKLRQQVKILK